MKFWSTLSETLSENFDSLRARSCKASNLCLKVPEMQNSRMAQMIDFFTKPLFKNAKNQSRKGGSLEAR